MEKIIQSNITNIGDPMILLYEGTYYMYCSHTDEGYTVYSSTNLKEFIEVGLCLDKKDSFGISQFWAPEVIYYHDTFYMIYSARSLEDNLMHLQIATSKSPLGPFKDIKKTPLIQMEKLSTIDGHIFIDDDERIYLFFSLDCSTNIIDGVHTSQIYAIELTNDFMSTKGDYVMISTPSSAFELKSGPEWLWNEGPFVIKHNNKYYLNYSTNFYASKDYCVGCLVAKNVLGPYIKQKEKPILSYIENEISGPGHNAFFKAIDGTLMTSFHIHTDYNHPSGDRRACFAKAYFNEKDELVIDYK